jgi:hypothetical protein
VILPGTYQNGFAPRDGEPLFPELWRGCVGAWNPGLGPTGLRLFDWSPYKNHGTLTNMPAADGWKTSQGRHALNFAGGTTFVDTASPGPVTNKRSVSLWFRTSQSFASNQYGYILFYGTATSFPADIGKSLFVGFGSDPTFGTNAFGVSQYGDSVGASSLNDGRWHHGCIVNDGTLYQVWVDKLLRASKSMTTNSTSSNILLGRSNLSFPLGSNMNYVGEADDIAIYNRALSPNEIRLLASRRGIAYEMAPQGWTSSQIAAYRARQYSQIIGGGVI